MSLSLRLRTVELIVRFLKGELDRVGGYAFQPQKKYIIADEDGGPKPLVTATCESQGVSSEYVYRIFREFEASADLCPHSLLIMRHGKIIAEGYWRPYMKKYPMDVFSLSKSVVGMAVGMAVEEGILEPGETLSSIFPDKISPVRSLFQKEVTIENLLTMSSGVGFNEVGMALDADWVKAFMTSEFAFNPRTQFFYNSLNSYMLSAVINKKTGQSLMQYLTPRLFEPLGIYTATWETCPMGIEKGGWGLHLTTHDMAKLGLLYLRRGKWEGKQLIPESWVEKSTTAHIETGVEGVGRYGYQLWLPDMGDCYLFNGAFSQNVYCIPELDVVVAMTCGSSDLFAAVSCNDLVKKYFFDNRPFSETSLAENKPAQKRLEALLERLEVFTVSSEQKKRSWLQRVFAPERQSVTETPEAASRCGGRIYTFKRSFAGLMPLTLQTVHVNYALGISRLNIRFDSDGCLLSVTEGSNENQLRIGYDEYRYNTLSFHGEPYVVAARGIWRGTAAEPTLHIRAAFIETPTTRIINITFKEEKVVLTFDDHPSTGDSAQMLGGLVSGGRYVDSIMDLALKSEQLTDVYGAFLKPVLESEVE